MMHHTDLSTQTIKLFKANTHLSAKRLTEDRVTYLAGDCHRPPSGPGLCYLVHHGQHLSESRVGPDSSWPWTRPLRSRGEMNR